MASPAVVWAEARCLFYWRLPREERSVISWSNRGQEFTAIEVKGKVTLAFTRFNGLKAIADLKGNPPSNGGVAGRPSLPNGKTHRSAGPLGNSCANWRKNACE